MGANRLRNHLAPKIGVIRLLEEFHQHLGVEEVNPHGAEVGHLGVVAAYEAFQHLGVFGLLHEVRDAPFGVPFEYPEAGGLRHRDGLDGHGDVGPFLPVIAGHLGVIHAVEMVSGQDEDVGRAGMGNLAQLLADCVRRALVPLRADVGLFGGQNLHPAGMEGVEAVSAGDVAVQRDRVELGQDGDAVDAGVDAVAQGDVNQAVLAGNRHGGLGALLGERKQAFADPPAENDAQDLVNVRHRKLLLV